MLEAHQIRQFYLRGFNLQGDISKKQVKARTHDQRFITVNRTRRLKAKSLKRLLIHHAPLKVYASVLEWLMPERVGTKSLANKAYPIGGEYVVDIDVPQMWRPWNGHGSNNLHAPGFQIAYERIMDLLDKITENYTNISIVFSGKRGFHIHVHDFDIRDWTHYKSFNPIKSHEVARFIYTLHLQASCGSFSRYHFSLSSDPMRVMTIPGSLNGETGLACFEVGTPTEFERLTMNDLVRRSDARRHLYQGFTTLGHAHPEPLTGR